MAKSKAKKAIESVKEKVVAKVVSTVLLRDASTGVFFKGTRPAGSPSGKFKGEPFWEV